MNIGIDTFDCEHGRSGYGSYLMSFVAALKKNDTLNWTLFGQEVDRYTYDKDTKFSFVGLEAKDTPFASRLWHRFFANRFYKKQGFDAVLYPAASIMCVPKTTCASICIVNGIPQNKKVLHALKKAKLLIAASTFVKDYLIEKSVLKNKIFVVYDGIDKNLFFPKPLLQEESATSGPFAIKKPYFIYASKLQDPSKKHIELIKAFDLFKKKTKLPFRLVLAGSQSEYSLNIHKAVFALESASDIFLTGFFPHENMADLYLGAQACLFPATCEGAGLPVLEAMACGVPVACCDTKVLKEITGGKAVFFDSDDINSIENAMETIVFQKQKTLDLVQEGLQWTKNFSWQKTALDTSDLIKKYIVTKSKKIV